MVFHVNLQLTESKNAAGGNRRQKGGNKMDVTMQVPPAHSISLRAAYWQCLDEKFQRWCRKRLNGSGEDAYSEAKSAARAEACC